MVTRIRALTASVFGPWPRLYGDDLLVLVLSSFSQKRAEFARRGCHEM